MRKSDWRRSRFDGFDDQPLVEMPNLLDIMLVFACGLIAALASGAEQLTQQSGGQEIVQGREIPDVPRGVGDPASGYESMGQVYRDPESGKMILIGPGRID